MRRFRRLWGLGLAAFIGSAPVFTSSDPGLKLEDRLDLIQVDHRLLAVGTQGTVLEAELEIGERIHRLESRGRIALATTSVRLLATRAGAAGFTKLRYRIEERNAPPPDSLVSERVALVSFPHRVVAFGASSGGWARFELGSREEVRNLAADAGLAAVITDRRAAAFSPQNTAFVSTPLTPDENIESISIQAGSITLITSRRVLVFPAGAPRWIDLIRVGRRSSTLPGG